VERYRESKTGKKEMRETLAAPANGLMTPQTLFRIGG